MSDFTLIDWAIMLVFAVVIVAGTRWFIYAAAAVAGL